MSYPFEFLYVLRDLYYDRNDNGLKKIRFVQGFNDYEDVIDLFIKHLSYVDKLETMKIDEFKSTIHEYEVDLLLDFMVDMKLHDLIKTLNLPEDEYDLSSLEI